MDKEKNNKKSKKIIIVIILLILFLLLFFWYRGKGFFPMELHEYLTSNNIAQGPISEEFLKENNLYDEKFVCESIYYSGNIIEFDNCVIEDEEENYCIFENNELECFYKSPESSFNILTKIPQINYNEDQEFSFEYTEDSNLKIDEVKYCTTTDNTCSPTTIYNDEKIKISTESLTNKVCFQATYSNGSSSEIICTEDIVLDKTAPSIEKLLIDGVTLTNNWYNDLSASIDATVSDNLTGVKNFDIKKDIKEGKNVVVVTAYDNAGNESTKEFTYKVDVTNPNVGTIIVQGEKGLNGWYTSDVKITKENGSDELSGHRSTNLNITSLSDTLGTNIILTTLDNALNKSETQLLIKIDTVKPTITGIEDLVVVLNSEVNLLEGVTASDGTSKVSGEVEVIQNNLDTSTAGEYYVTYQVSDYAGNTETVKRKIIVESRTPNVEFSIDETVLTNGWSTDKIDVNIEIIDNKAIIEEVFYCTTTSDACLPNTKLTTDVVTVNAESDSNRVCVLVDYGKSVTVCSDNYKIDKTAPIINDPTVSGDPGNNGWYKTHITLDENGAVESLSGLKDINIDIKKINYDTASETVTIIATDNAGNVATKEFIFKVDTVKPAIGDYTVLGSKGYNDYYITDVTVSGENATDSLSGLASIDVNEYSFTTDTTGTDIIITATDNAGNTTIKRETIKIDKTEPTIVSYNITEKVESSDWHKTVVIVDDIIATDNISGVDQSTIETLEYSVDYETSGEYIEIQIDDLAGNRYTERIPVKIDLTPPVSGSINLDGVLGGNGWYNSDVVIGTSEGSDSLSGIKSSELNMTIVTGEQLETTVYLTTTDKAGHTSQTSKDVKIDKIVPEVGTIVPEGTIGANGWYVSNVIIGKTDGIDTGSGHASTTVDILEITENTVGTTVTITTRDQSNLEATYSEIFKVDKMVPIITKNEDIVIEKGTDIDLTTKFTSVFGVSTGTTVCSVADTTVLEIGTYDITCTATSVAGLSSDITTTFEVVQTYEILEYIESTGTQYIETGLMNTGDYIFEDKFLITDIGVGTGTGSWIVGGRVNPNYSLGVFVSDETVIAAYGSLTRTLYPAIKENIWYDMYFSRFKLNIGGVNYNLSGQTLIDEEYVAEIIIGGNLLAYDGVSKDNRNMKGQRKYFKITDATTGELLRHYIPVKLIATGEIGMWDLVEGKFYGNDGTGEFTSS